jgi:hypothetical protein
MVRRLAAYGCRRPAHLDWTTASPSAEALAAHMRHVEDEGIDTGRPPRRISCRLDLRAATWAMSADRGRPMFVEARIPGTS